MSKLKQQEFVIKAKKLTDAYYERQRVLDSTIYRNSTNIPEMRKERRKVLDELWSQVELEKDLLRVELGLSQVK